MLYHAYHFFLSAWQIEGDISLTNPCLFKSVELIVPVRMTGEDDALLPLVLNQLKKKYVWLISVQASINQVALLPETVMLYILDLTSYMLFCSSAFSFTPASSLYFKHSLHFPQYFIVPLSKV